MELKQIVDKLVGSHTPTGMHSVDVDRLEKLKLKQELVYEMLLDIVSCSYHKDSKEESVAAIGKEAYAFLESIKELEY